MLTGADIVDELKLIRDETIHSVKIRSIRVKQTNCPELLEIDNCDRVPVIIRDNTADSCILDMQWNQWQDNVPISLQTWDRSPRYIKTGHIFWGR